MAESASEGNRFAPPTAHVDDVALSSAGDLAGRGTRLGAALIDVVIAMLAFGLLAVVTPFNLFSPDPTAGVVSVLIINLFVGFGLFLLVHGYLLATRGQTVGKTLLKIRIIRSDGTRASFARLAGLRYFVNSLFAVIPFVGWIYGLVDALLIFRESHKCLHDNIADTIVVKA